MRNKFRDLIDKVSIEEEYHCILEDSFWKKINSKFESILKEFNLKIIK